MYPNGTWLKWESGRQGTGYQKMMLARSRRLGFDLYLIRFPKGSQAPEHTDPVEDGKEHHRINFILEKPRRGGTFFCNRYKKWWRFIRFRPDREPHQITEVYWGQLLYLSFGWVRDARQ